MDIRKAAVILTHIIALAGFLILTLSGYINVPISLIFLFALFYSFQSEFYNKNSELSNAATTVLGVALTLILISMVIFWGYEFFIVLIYFLVFVQIVKLLGVKTVRDIQQIILLSFFQVLTAAVTTSKIYFAFILILYVFIAICTVIVFNIYRENLDDQINKRQKMSYKQLLMSTAVIWLSIFLIGSLIFILMPRFKGSFISGLFVKREELRTGFSDKVSLGKVGEIKNDNSPVMRVKFLNVKKSDLPNEIYWRGVALNDFDGIEWKIGDKIKSKVFKEDYQGVVRLANSKRPRNVYLQEIITQPLDTDVLFAANFPLGYKNIPLKRISAINESYFHYGKYASSTRYFAYSNLEKPSDDLLINDRARFSDWIESNFAYSFNPSDKVSNLAEELYDSRDSIYENVVNVENYLAENHSYTRVLQSGQENYPIDDFLFNGKEGHCEYFASSMVVLLREMGIPSRLVTGFVGGEYNTHGDYFLVRESNAHAWVEVFFPSFGWISFDPTPGGEGNYLNSIPSILTYFEYLKYRWNRYVVDFDQKDQIRIYKRLRSDLRKSKFNAVKLNRMGQYRNIILIIFSFLIVLYLIRSRKTSLNSLFWGNKVSKSTKIYSNSLKLLSKKGLNKDDSSTPSEFVEHIRNSLVSQYMDFNDLTNIYLKARFGNNSDNNDLLELEKRFNNLRKSIKSSA